MKFAKIENGYINVFNKRFVHDEVNGMIYVHPTEAQLRQCGYKEYIETECTLEEKEGYYIVSGYLGDADTITQTWEYEEIVPEEISDELS